MTKLDLLIDETREAIASWRTNIWNLKYLITTLTKLLKEIQKRKKSYTPTKPLIALYNFIPCYCPNCGAKLGWNVPSVTDIPYLKKSFLKGDPARCPGCGTYCQYAKTKHLMEAAQKKSGDELKQFIADNQKNLKFLSCSLLFRESPEYKTVQQNFLK